MQTPDLDTLPLVRHQVTNANAATAAQLSVSVSVLPPPPPLPPPHQSPLPAAISAFSDLRADFTRLSLASPPSPEQRQAYSQEAHKFSAFILRQFHLALEDMGREPYPSYPS